MKNALRAGLGQALLALLCSAPLAVAAPDTTRVVEDPSYGLVVSGTRTLRDAIDVPATIDVVRGETLRRRGARTLADALQNITGVDLADGADGGSRLPNIGVWGLKEFDALLVSLDGVPLGGPFNPALEQIPVEDIDRIEVTRGPQGTLYGLSAFAGMVQVFTRPSGRSGLEVSQQVSSYNGIDGGFNWNGTGPGGTRARFTGTAGRGDGWQDRTDFTRFRGTLSLAREVGPGTASLQLIGLEDRQGFGTPVPIENVNGKGVISTGYDPRRNDAVGGAHIDHLVFGATGNLTWPLGSALRLESTLGVTSDRQRLIRSFVDTASQAADSVDADGQNLRPKETTFYGDARLVKSWNAHEIVGGAAVTIGKLRVEGNEFDFNVKRLPVPVVPDVSQLNVGEDVDAEDMRFLAGFFLHDSWNLHPRLAVTGGGRVDLANEELESGEKGTPEFRKDSREDTGWSADGGLLVRLLAEREGGTAFNLFGNVRRNFKPAAPNLFEAAEGTRILEPERSLAYEGGLKSSAMDEQVAFEFSYFKMDLENQVIAVDNNGTPGLANAGKTRFKGEEVKLRLAPAALAGLSLDGGFAHHDPRFVVFTRPNGALVNGKQVEVAPRQLWNVGATYAARCGASVWTAARGQDRRPLNKRNTYFDDAYAEWDAGAAYVTGPWRLAVIGRNLGDSRHVVGESELGDGQYYIAAPRRLTAQITVKM